MSDSRAIGVFDSGLGGLTVAKEIIKILPNEDIVYFGDTGRVPYGTKGEATIKKYAFEDESFLLSHNVKLIVAACGTVSSVASADAQGLPVPFIEVISHSVKDAVKATKTGKIGILATAATVKSGAHKRKILELMPEAKVTEAEGSLLVSLVEEGFTSKDDSLVKEAVGRYVSVFKENHTDTLILGCTHFPCLENAIRDALGNDVTLINMGVSTAKAVKERLKSSDLLNDTGKEGIHRFFVSDKGATFKKTASVLLGETLDESRVQTVDIKAL